MTRKLETLFNLPPAVEADVEPEQAEAAVEPHKEIIRSIDTAIDKIDAALPSVRDLEASDKEMDDLADLAKDKFNELMELGLMMDSRFSGTVFQTASTMLGHAITAKQSKLDKKLRMVDLQMKKMKLDMEKERHDKKMSESSGGDGTTPIEGEGMLMDRNALLAHILNKPAK